MITESPNLQLPLQCALAGWRQLMAGWRPAASTSSVRLIIFLEAGRSLARAVPHGHAQGYADVRSTGQAIHRAKVFLFVGKLETRSPLRSAMAALRLSWSRFAYITCTSYMHRACIGQKTPTRLQLHFHLGTTVHTSFPRRYTTASAA